MSDTDTQEQSRIYFMCAVLAIYQRNEEEAPKQRHLNVLLESQSENLDKAALARISRSTMARLHAENGITPDLFKDLVILNIFPLGMMTPTEFNGPEEKVDAGQ